MLLLDLVTDRFAVSFRVLASADLVEVRIDVDVFAHTSGKLRTTCRRNGPYITHADAALVASRRLRAPHKCGPRTRDSDLRAGGCGEIRIPAGHRRKRRRLPRDVDGDSRQCSIHHRGATDRRGRDARPEGNHREPGRDVRRTGRVDRRCMGGGVGRGRDYQGTPDRRGRHADRFRTERNPEEFLLRKQWHLDGEARNTAGLQHRPLPDLDDHRPRRSMPLRTSFDGIHDFTLPISLSLATDGLNVFIATPVVSLRYGSLLRFFILGDSGIAVVRRGAVSDVRTSYGEGTFSAIWNEAGAAWMARVRSRRTPARRTGPHSAAGSALHRRSHG